MNPQEQQRQQEEMSAKAQAFEMIAKADQETKYWRNMHQDFCNKLVAVLELQGEVKVEDIFAKIEELKAPKQKSKSKA